MVAMIGAAGLDELLQVGALGWTGSVRDDALLIRLGAPLQAFKANREAVTDLNDQASIDNAYDAVIATWASYELPPGGLILCQSCERIRLTAGLCGWISTLSHLARVGLMVHLGSAAVMPRFDGHLTLELYNAAPTRLRLHHGMPAAKVLIEHVAGPTRSAVRPNPFYGQPGHPRVDTPTSSATASEATVDCEFCAEFMRDENGGRIIQQLADWMLLPTLGCFVAGYCLLMPLDHRGALAELPKAELACVQGLLDRTRRLIASIYGPVIVAEHGPGRCDLGASCCSHAHLHCIPIGNLSDAVTAAYEQVGGPPFVLRELTELSAFAGRPYLYLSPNPRAHFVWHATGFPRQFIRRVCANLLGVGWQFDWRDHPFVEQMGETLTRLRAAVSVESGPR